MAGPVTIFGLLAGAGLALFGLFYLWLPGHALAHAVAGLICAAFAAYFFTRVKVTT